GEGRGGPREGLGEGGGGAGRGGLGGGGGGWGVMVGAPHRAAGGRRPRGADAEPFGVYLSRHEEKNRAVKRSYHERDAREQGIFIPEAHTLVERLLRA